MNKKAVVLLSGGMDSTTSLAIALHAGYECYALSFDYGQHSQTEINAAKEIAKHLGAKDHRVIKLDVSCFLSSALTNASIHIPEHSPEKNEIPVTYVPARNTIFLSMALGFAEVIDARHIFLGVNAVDFSNYPDCDSLFLDAFEKLANIATKAGREGDPFKLEAPLVHLSKAEIIKKGLSLGIDYSLTVSCYQSDDHGRACGRCSSCLQRSAGFEAVGVADPTRYR